MTEYAPAKPRLHTLHALRAIAALCVAVLHLYAVENLSADSILPHRMELSRIGTDLFFVVSGAVLAFSTVNRPHRLSEAASFLYDRVSRIMPLYWFVTAIVLTVWALSGQRMLSNFVGQPEFWSTAFLLPVAVSPAIPVAWSLTHLLFFYGVFSLTLMAPQKFETLILSVWALVVVALRVTVGDNSPQPFVDLMAHPSALEFIAGIRIMRLSMSGYRMPTVALGAAALAWFAFVAIFAGPHPDINTFKNEDVRFLTLGVASMLLVATAISFDFAKSRAPSKIFRFLGDSSFGIYLGHCLAIAVVARAWRQVEHPGAIDNAAAIVVMMALSIALGWALHNYIELPAKAFTSQAKPHVLSTLSSIQRATAEFARAQ